MIAQDTGGAIIGPARADIYLGAGDEAARAAGRFKHFGNMVMLVPNELDPRDAARSVPLPLTKPKEIAGEQVVVNTKPAEPKTNPKPDIKPEPKAVAARKDTKKDVKKGEPELAARTTRVAGPVETVGAEKNEARKIVSVPLPKARPARPQQP